MITRGEQWGIPSTRVEGDILVNGDLELAVSSTDCRLIVTGGDIAHSLGDPPPPGMGSNCTEVPIDALRVSLTLKSGSTRTQIAASHVMIGTWLRGRFVCVSNGGFIGPWNVSPRAHPNDGFLDLMSVDSSMGLQQRLLARKRSVLGTHTPHPLVETSRTRSIEFSSLSRSEPLCVDGQKIRSWACVQVEIVPDYWRLLV
jgi:hypothetical protein